ncbi:methyltransferase [Spiroplasma endosymbiont of Dactylopius coccus]
MDTILLSNFIKIKPSTKTIIDFGTNNAVIPIILAAKFQGKVIGIEIQEPAVELALENIKLNNLEKRIVIVHEDIKIYAQREKEKVDLIVCNPPFFSFMR